MAAIERPNPAIGSHLSLIALAHARNFCNSVSNWTENPETLALDLKMALLQITIVP
jgi:hypothetical protein